MSSAYSLSAEEFGLIRGMDPIRPRMTDQAILAYFTRPGRDINHTVIGAIRRGWNPLGVRTASAAEVDDFMRGIEAMWRMAPVFLRGASASARRLLLLDWWPVGQGLFASGGIVGGDGPPLNWTYDCGTSSADELLVDALAAFTRQQTLIGASRLRLAVLSHFDNDHISGIVRLLGQFEVQTLLLPYIPLWRRLVIAIEQGISVDDEIFDFFLDPAAWLDARGDGRIGEILFVPGAGPDDLPPDAPEGEDDERGPEEGRLDLKPEYGDTPREADENLTSPAAGMRVQVRFLRRGGRLVAPLFWEFVPYNDETLAPRATPAFLRAAGPLIETLRDDARGRAKALADLKALYDLHFGKTAEARNVISLFLYSGAVGTRLRLGHGPASGLPFEATDYAQMHTGDGLLNDVARYDAFARFYGPANRLGRSKVFQVMHHGARSSWHAGLAAKVAPTVSIFSSDPARRRPGHPHAEVLRDFWPQGPKQVDRVQGYRVRRRMYW